MEFTSRMMLLSERFTEKKFANSITPTLVILLFFEGSRVKMEQNYLLAKKNYLQIQQFQSLVDF